MKKKSILFIVESFNTGGIFSSLLNIVNELCDSFDVTVFTCVNNDNSKFFKSNVKILKANWKLEALNSSITVLRKKTLKMYIYKMIATVWSKLFDNRLPIYDAISNEQFLGEYDLVCVFSPERNRHVTWSGFSRLAQRKTKSGTLISWIHYDPNNVDCDIKFNKKYFDKLSYLCGVSKSVIDAFSKKYPNLKCDMTYCYNILNINLIDSLKLEKKDFSYPSDKLVLFSAARLAKEKAFERAIHAFSESFHKYKNVKWFIAGEGTELIKIKEAIKQEKLENHVILIGNKRNPYPYMKDCDLYLNVSYHEALPMVFLEALYLKVPVFCTNTLSAKEILSENVNAIICENNSESMSFMMDYVLSNIDIIKKMKKKLLKEDYKNYNIVKRMNSYIK